MQWSCKGFRRFLFLSLESLFIYVVSYELSNLTISKMGQSY
jgi:hypothetical protein